jgi:hypothetical protein
MGYKYVQIVTPASVCFIGLILALKAILFFKCHDMLINDLIGFEIFEPTSV